MSIILEKTDKRDHVITETARVPLPNVNMREWAREIEQQGSLGSCTANAAVSLLELAYLRAGKNKNFSRLYLYYYIREFQDRVKYPDGGIPRNIGKSLVKHGICREDIWPYDVSKQNIEPDYDARKEAGYYKIGGYSKIPLDNNTINNIKLSLCDGIPVLVTFWTHTDFYIQMFAQGSKMNETPWTTHDWDSVTTKINPRNQPHESVIIGYDDATERFLVENSWGNYYCGDKGFFGLPYNKIQKQSAFEFWILEDIGVPYISFWEKIEEDEVIEPVPLLEINKDTETEVEINFRRNSAKDIIQTHIAINLGTGKIYLKTMYPDIDVNTITVESSLSRNIKQYLIDDVEATFCLLQDEEALAVISFAETSGQRYLLSVLFDKNIDVEKKSLADSPVIEHTTKVTLPSASSLTYAGINFVDIFGSIDIDHDTVTASDRAIMFSVGYTTASYTKKTPASVVISFAETSGQRYLLEVEFVERKPETIFVEARRALTSKGKKKTNILNMFNHPTKGLGLIPYVYIKHTTIQVTKKPTNGTGFVELLNMKGPAYLYTGGFSPDEAIIEFDDHAEQHYSLRLVFVEPNMPQTVFERQMQEVSAAP